MKIKFKNFKLDKLRAEVVIDKTSTAGTRFERQLVVNISMFLLGQEKMKDTYWSISAARYFEKENKLTVGVNTIDSRLGTTLKNMRSHARELAHYLRDQHILPRVARILFVVEGEMEPDFVDQINQLINEIEKDLELQ